MGHGENKKILWIIQAIQSNQFENILAKLLPVQDFKGQDPLLILCHYVLEGRRKKLLF